MFTTDATILSARLRAPLSRGELAALVGALSVSLYLIFLVSRQVYVPTDLYIYCAASQGDVRGFYYAYWSLPFFRLLCALPDVLMVAVYHALSVGGLWLACRVFGGRFAILGASYLCFWVLWFGQYSGIMVGGLALGWWGLTTRRWGWGLLGILVALVKFHACAPLVLLLWLAADVPRGVRLRLIAGSTAVFALSLALYGLWPLEIIQAIWGADPPRDTSSYTVWRWLGPWALVLWLPLVRVSRARLPLAVGACCALALPYFQTADLVLVLVFPVWPLLPLVSYVGVLRLVYAPVLQLVVVMPLSVYVGEVLALVGSRHKKTPDSGLLHHPGLGEVS